MTASWAEAGEEDLRREALPWSRIFAIWAERLGLVEEGGGGVWEGVERRERWSWVRFARGVVRSGSGEERDLEVGSRVRGREVKVSRGSVVILGGVGTGTGYSVAVMLSVPD